MNKRLTKMLIVLFICSIVILLLAGPLLIYSFPYLSVDYFRQKVLPILTVDELSHIQDVMNIFRFIIVIGVSALVIFLVSILWFSLSKVKKHMISGLLWGSFITLILIGLIVAFVIADFQYVFTLFHELFFPQGNWAFDKTSVLITLFPLDFFKTISMKIFVTSMVSSSLVFVGNLYLYIKYK